MCKNLLYGRLPDAIEPLSSFFKISFSLEKWFLLIHWRYSAEVLRVEVSRGMCYRSGPNFNYQRSSCLSFQLYVTAEYFVHYLRSREKLIGVCLRNCLVAIDFLMKSTVWWHLMRLSFTKLFYALKLSVINEIFFSVYVLHSQ